MTALVDMKAPAQVPDVPAHRDRYRPSPHSFRNKLGRAAWGVIWLVLFRPSPKPLHAWRRLLLRAFGARLGRHATVHASVRIWARANRELGDHSALSPGVDCYAHDRVSIGARATVSQYSFLCTASHDPDSADMTLITAPITIGNHAWVAADTFIGPGVCIGEGAVVGTRASVFRDVPAWLIVVGNPARPLRQRSRAVAAASARQGENP